MVAHSSPRVGGQDPLAAALAHLVAAVEALTTSEAWVAMLRVAARFPAYSPSNVLLIGVQQPDATRVAGIRTWNAVGRRVRKGEHGIAILAPCRYGNRTTPEDLDPPGGDRGGPQPTKGTDLLTAGADEPAAPADGTLRVREVRAFRVVHVFDVTQTEGDPLPDPAPTLLSGPASAELWEHLTRQVAQAGYTLERGPCGSANGWTDPTRHLVRIRDDVEPLQALKTLAHELGHIRADHITRFPEYAADRNCRGQAEVEAESIAYLVLAEAGHDCSAYSVPYVAGWAEGDPNRLRESMAKVVSAARGLVQPAEAPTGPATEGSLAGAAPHEVHGRTRLL